MHDGHVSAIQRYRFPFRHLGLIGVFHHSSQTTDGGNLRTKRKKETLVVQFQAEHGDVFMLRALARTNELHIRTE